MPETSAILTALLASLTNARHGTTLALDQATLGGTSAAALPELVKQLLPAASVTLQDVKIPDSVTGTILTISGTMLTATGVTVDVTFAENAGEVAVQALFRAGQPAALQSALPGLPGGFFDGIVVSDGTASVSVPGLVQPLTLSSPRCGVVGLVTPSSGLVATSVAPHVDGQVTPHGVPRKLLVEVETATTGFRVAPAAEEAWTFDDLGWLIPGLGLLAAFPDIIPAKGIGVRAFDLNLYRQAPGLSSISLDVAGTSAPDAALWSPAGGKVQLKDVIVTLDLTYSGDGTLTLPGTGSVQGNFQLGSLALNAQIPFPPTGIWSLTAFPNLSLDSLDGIASLLDGGSSQLKALLPAKLADIGGFELSYLRVAVDVGSFSLAEFTFALTTTRPWRLIEKAIELSSLRIQFTIDGTPSVTGMVVGTMRLGGDSDVVVSFGRSTPRESWRLDVISPAIALPSLGDLAALTDGNLGSLVKAGALDRQQFVLTNLNIGLTLPPPALTNVGLTLQLAGEGGDLTADADWKIIPGVLTLTQFSFGFQVNWGTPVTKEVFGRFVLNGLEFDVKFASQGTADASTNGLLAEYTAPAGPARPVNIKDLIYSISHEASAYVPDGLEITLADAVLAYIGTGGGQKFLFAMDIGVALPVTDLPLVGSALPADATVGVKNLKVVVASAALTSQDVAFINGISAKPVLTAQGAGASGDVIPAGFSIVAELQLGELSVLMTSPPPQRKEENKAAVATRAALPSGAAAAAPASDPVMWLPVQKTFGPVQIQKVGFSYQDGELFVLSNLSLSAGGLEIDLIGIGIGSPIHDPEVAFTIQGLAVSFAAGPVTIMGGMLGKLKPLDFVGVLSIQTPELSLSAFGGYADYQDHPSFFLYGVLNAPIGGPPAFFVTGIAAGAGFNRKLVLPDVSGVAAFPLIAWAQGSGTPSMDPSKPVRDQVGQALTQLAQSGVVAPSVGDYWFAAGVQFTSFEIIQSFALLTVSLGTRIEIALLGLCTLTLPPDEPEPVARVQLALKVAFSPDEGLLDIAGQLTPASYVLAPDCRLTGGFAFYLWFAGDHAGETVVTLGGYNPGFTVPQYYPAVPRVGLSWQVIPELKITGELYFALTSNVVMAGGKLSAVWKSGSVSAWFTYWADFLMTFSPFHYAINGGIDLGASFTVDLAFVSLSVTVHVGVTVELWGPPFAGRATVNLSVISFTILFNDHPPETATAIPWPQFVSQLLPAQPAAARPAARALEAAAPAAVQINVTSGLVKTLDPDPEHPVHLVTAETFQCSVLTVIPSKDVTFEGNASYAPDSRQPADKDNNPVRATVDFGVGPAGLAPEDFTPSLNLKLSSDQTSAVLAYRRFSSAPKALWEYKSFDQRGVPRTDPSTALTQPTIPDALTGLTLVPDAGEQDRTRPVPLESLLFSLADQQRFGWSPGQPPGSDPFTDQTVAGTITEPKVTGVRRALLDALAGQGITVTTSVDVSRLASPASTDLQAAPRLRLLGGPPPAP
jgi:hypothetical protein